MQQNCETAPPADMADLCAAFGQTSPLPQASSAEDSQSFDSDSNHLIRQSTLEEVMVGVSFLETATDATASGEPADAQGSESRMDVVHGSALPVDFGDDFGDPDMPGLVDPWWACSPDPSDDESDFERMWDFDRHELLDDVNDLMSQEVRAPPSVSPSDVANGLKVAERLESFLCASCHKDNGEVRCLDCQAVLCVTCDEQMHAPSAPGGWHCRFRQVEGLQALYEPHCGCGDGTPHHYHITAKCMCDTACQRQTHFLEVFRKGPLKVAHVSVCVGKPLVSQLLQLRLYPATRQRPTMVFPFETLEECDPLEKTGRIPHHAYFDSIMQYRRDVVFRGLRQVNPNDHTRKLFLAAMDTYRDGLALLAKEVHNPAERPDCPACHQGGVSVHADAIFKIKNKQASGRLAKDKRDLGWADASRQLVFGPRTVIQQFLEDCAPKWNKGATYECSDFTQKENANRTHGEAKLDTTGGLDVTCRHDFVLSWIQLAHGERYAYTLLALLCAFGAFDQQGVTPRSQWKSFTCWTYDVTCQFLPYLRNLLEHLPDHVEYLREPIEELISTPHGIGAGHVIGHQIKCQLNLWVRHLLGAGTTDGENNERLHSRVIGFVRQLKYRSPVNFRRLLGHILDHLNFEKATQIGTILKKRYTNAVKLRAESSSAAAKYAEQLQQQVHMDSRLALEAWQQLLPLEDASCENIHSVCESLVEIITPIYNRAQDPSHPLMGLWELWEVSTARALFLQEKKKIKSTHVSATKLAKKIKACESSMKTRMKNLESKLIGTNLTWENVSCHDSMWWANALAGDYEEVASQVFERNFTSTTADESLAATRRTAEALPTEEEKKSLPQRTEHALELRTSVRLLVRKLFRELCIYRGATEELDISVLEAQRTVAYFRHGHSKVQAALEGT